VVGIATELWDGLCWVLFRSLEACEIFISSETSSPALGPNKPPSQCVKGVLSQEVKRSVCKANHSSPFSVEVKRDSSTAGIRCPQGQFQCLL
jgi:hypothetical protein